jgi:hypothetical protein
VSAGAAAPRADLFGIDGKSLSVGPQETHGTLDVFDHRRECIARRQTVIDGCNEIAAGEKFSDIE